MWIQETVERTTLGETGRAGNGQSNLIKLSSEEFEPLKARGRIAL